VIVTSSVQDFYLNSMGQGIQVKTLEDSQWG